MQINKIQSFINNFSAKGKHINEVCNELKEIGYNKFNLTKVEKDVVKISSENGNNKIEEVIDFKHKIMTQIETAKAYIFSLCKKNKEVKSVIIGDLKGNIKKFKTTEMISINDKPAYETTKMQAYSKGKTYKREFNIMENTKEYFVKEGENWTKLFSK
jgi:predicted transcriptional regulator